MELNRKIFMGIVEDNKDPNRKGRIKVRVQTLYHCLAVEDIPYAAPFAGLAGKKFEIPAIGKIVNVLFLNDDLYSPLYIYSENYNINLQNKLNSLTDEEYVDFISLLFDEKTQIYVKGQELTIDMLLNKITITNTNKNAINIELKDNKQILNLGSRDSNQDAVLGTNFFEWMDKFIDELSNPTCLIGNVGAPILRPFLDMLCMEYKMKRPTFVSNNVKIVDNGKVNILKRTPDTNNKKHDIDLIIPEDECSEFEKVPGAGTIQEQIENQNKKACEELENAAATDEVPYREHPSENSNLELTSEETKKVWSTDAQNQINQLHPEFRPYVIKFLNACEAKNILVNITSGYRSIEKQKELQSTGNAAKPGYSYHNYGLAIDISLKNSDDWNTVGQVGEAIGLRWGKYFKNPKSERWHFDGAYIFNLSTAELKKKYDNGQLSNGYVNLGGYQATYAENKFKDQPYSKPTKEDCDNAKFNRKEAKQIKKNTNNQSDEKEQAPTPEEEQASSNQSNESDIDCATKTLFKTITSGESKDYNTTLGYDKYIPEFVPGTTKKVQPITALTLGEIKKVQDQMVKNGGPSSAVGKYQFIKKTLIGAQSKCGLSDNDLFSPINQDKMAAYLLENRGLKKWLNNEITDNQFQLSLAQEWASIAVPQDTINNKGVSIKKGQSYYSQNSSSGYAGTTNQEIQEAMRKAKDECAG